MTEWKRPSTSWTRPPTPSELDALYAALGTTRAASELRRQQREKQPKKKARRTR